MDSIIGKQCVICREAVKKSGSAIFCPDCGCPCHLACGKPQGPEMMNYSCLTCGAPRAEIARYKNDRELKLLTQLSKQQSAPKMPLEGRRKVGLVIGLIFFILGIVRFGLATSGMEFPGMGPVIFAAIPMVLGLFIFLGSLHLAKKDGW